MIRTRTSALALLFTMAAPAAYAWEDARPSEMFIDQVELGAVWSHSDLTVEDVCCDAVSASTAMGNSANGLVSMGHVTMSGAQHVAGPVEATNSLAGGDVTGQAAAGSTAYGNSAYGGTWMGDTVFNMEQRAEGMTRSANDIDLQNVGEFVGSSTANANVSVQVGEHGSIGAYTEQYTDGSVLSETDAVLARVSGAASVGTTALGNSSTTTGADSVVLVGALQETAASETIRGRTSLAIGSASDVAVSTTASGNAVTVHNTWGYTRLGDVGSPAYQLNLSSISADADVRLDDWSGAAHVGSYGVGNSMLVSNVGSGTLLYGLQSNYGDVASTTSFEGSSTSGGVAITSATSIGNAATATLCNMCGTATVGGEISQFNAGSVYAQGVATTTATGGVHSSATAIGNSATFQSYGD